MQDIEGLRGGLVRELGCVRVWRAELEEEGLVYCVSAARPPTSLSAVETLGVGNQQSPTSLGELNRD